MRFFLHQRRSIYTPCFRSERFRTHAENVVRGFLQQFHGREEFEAVLCRCGLPDRFTIRLEEEGFPLFFLHQDTVDRNWCHCAACRTAFGQRLQQRYGSIDRANRELGTDFASFVEATIPLSPGHGPDREHRFPGIHLWADPQKLRRLWYEAAELWSESIAGGGRSWKAPFASSIPTPS